MTRSFNFDVEHSYSGADGISVPVTLRHGQDKVSFEADVDTGSTFCIFNRGHAETLGLSVESGERTRFETVTGSFDAYLVGKSSGRPFFSFQIVELLHRRAIEDRRDRARRAIAVR